MAKDRFRDWGLYHKLVATAVVAFAFATGLRAFLVIDGAFELTEEVVLAANPDEVWPWIVENDKRPDWQGEITRVQGLSSDIGRNRLVYWKRGYSRWRSFELTTALVVGRLFKSEQESDFDRRWWQVELFQLEPCRTRVVLKEVIRPTEYKDRFWFFRVEEERQQRLIDSVEALKRWVESEPSVCRPDEATITQ